MEYSDNCNKIGMTNKRDDDEDNDGEEEDFNNFPPKPAALLPHLNSISGDVNSSFSADDEQGPHASAQGGTDSADDA